MKRDQLGERERAPWECEVRLVLLYAAILRVNYNGAPRRFDNPEKARECIQGTPDQDESAF